MGAGSTCRFSYLSKTGNSFEGGVLKYSALAGAFGLTAYLAQIGAEGRTQFYSALSQTWKTKKFRERSRYGCLAWNFPQWMEESLESFRNGISRYNTQWRGCKNDTLFSLNTRTSISGKNRSESHLFSRNTARNTKCNTRRWLKKKKSFSLPHFYKTSFSRKRRIPCSVQDGENGTFVLTIGSAHFPGFSENPSASIFEITPREEAEKKKIFRVDYNDSSQKLFPIPQKPNTNASQRKKCRSRTKCHSYCTNGNGKTELDIRIVRKSIPKPCFITHSLWSICSKNNGIAIITLPAGDSVDMESFPMSPENSFWNNLMKEKEVFPKSCDTCFSNTGKRSRRNRKCVWNYQSKTARALLHVVPAGSDIEKKIYELLVNPWKRNDAEWFAEFITTIVTSNEKWWKCKSWTGGASPIIGLYELPLRYFIWLFLEHFHYSPRENFDE